MKKTITDLFSNKTQIDEATLKNIVISLIIQFEEQKSQFVADLWAVSATPKDTNR